ncbi:hypothetical protein [Carboxylicivirga linearis]|uniref:Lipoprotein n=1 Tax=Carboxylicivirga linearis TaxID=1628157 RepID=A0ABS5JRC5_9BACT|nr:hypothetical protein [Carboxylicivirga linearis]MBS2097439.1 hypothetical protein [Carboxylicivirga linearis]
MKNLAPIIIACLFVISFSSCTSYQIITLESTLNKPSSDGFIYEDDTVSVLYTFNGANAPLDVNIYNKLNTPLYINWNQSSVIINGQSFPLNPTQSKVNIEYSEVSTEYIYNSYTQGSGDGTIYHSDRSGFIPPQSNITIQGMNIWNSFLSPNDAISENKVIKANGSKITEYTYDLQSSPLDFRCYLTYSDCPEETWKSLDHQFWIESYYKCIDCKLPTTGNTFYLSKTTGAGTAVGAAALIGLTVIAISADPEPLDTEF